LQSGGRHRAVAIAGNCLRRTLRPRGTAVIVPKGQLRQSHQSRVCGPRRLDLPLVHQAGEVLERPIVRPLGLVGEAARGQLATRQVIPQTVAADSLSTAPVVRAVAEFAVPSLLALHGGLGQGGRDVNVCRSRALDASDERRRRPRREGRSRLAELSQFAQRWSSTPTIGRLSALAAAGQGLESLYRLAQLLIPAQLMFAFRTGLALRRGRIPPPSAAGPFMNKAGFNGGRRATRPRSVKKSYPPRGSIRGGLRKSANRLVGLTASRRTSAACGRPIESPPPLGPPGTAK